MFIWDVGPGLVFVQGFCGVQGLGFWLIGFRT